MPVRPATLSTQAEATWTDVVPVASAGFGGLFVGAGVVPPPEVAPAEGGVEAAASTGTGAAPAITYSLLPALRAAANSMSQPSPTSRASRPKIQTKIVPGTCRTGVRPSHRPSSAPSTTPP